MFASKRNVTVIAEGFKIVGSVTTEGSVEFNGEIDGELHCTSVTISPKAHIAGSVEAERVVIDGRVEGPIHGGEVVLKSQADVIGDIQCRSLIVEKGASVEGRLVRVHGANGRQAESAKLHGEGSNGGATQDTKRVVELGVEARHASKKS
jgi:cytoskeletal protein CcmA (bactofilin family)